MGCALRYPVQVVATKTPDPTLEMALLFALVALVVLIWYGIQ
ncbi:MAG TPA: hypothetical protein VFS23_26640 [Vicinamibacterales bacterium]|nr:hypothetical protein [Vicinamibacterales bacterium]